jgi:hypothetical protein
MNVLYRAVWRRMECVVGRAGSYRYGGNLRGQVPNNDFHPDFFSSLIDIYWINRGRDISTPMAAAADGGFCSDLILEEPASRDPSHRQEAPSSPSLSPPSAVAAAAGGGLCADS